MKFCRLTGFLVLVAALAAGCPNTRITFQRSSSQVFPAKPPGCEIQVLTLPPQRAYVELGTFDIQNMERNTIRTTTDLVNRVRKHACREGADAVLGLKNGAGYYVQATAVRWTQPTPVSPAPAPASAAPETLQ